MLLHAFLILLFGSPAGGSREGRAMWGSLEVTIRGPLLDTAGIALESGNASVMRLPGTRLLERREEARKAAVVRPPPDLNAAQEADPLPSPATLMLAPVAPARTELEPTPRLEPVVVEVPVLPAPLLEWTPRPALEPKLAPPARLAPVELPAVRAPPPPVAAPIVPAPLLQQAAPSAYAPKLAPPVELTPLEAPVARSPAPAAAQLPAAERPGLPPAERASPRDPQPVVPGARPSRDETIFDGRKPAADDSQQAGSGPRIDLDVARARARELAREGSGNRALLPFPMPPAPERKTKEQLAIEKAWKPDCKTAYKDLGLLAVVPLVANEFGEGNCRW
jgi:hypothetical protein